MTFVATISSKNQITMPVALLRKLGLKPGHKILFEETKKKITVRPVKTFLVDDIIEKFKSYPIPANLKGKSWEEIKNISDKKYTEYLAKKYKIQKFTK